MLLGALCLIVAIVLVAVQLRNWGFISSTHYLAWAAFAMNLGVSAVGLLTPERLWWIANATLSALALLLIGASTVPTAIVALVQLFWH